MILFDLWCSYEGFILRLDDGKCSVGGYGATTTTTAAAAKELIEIIVEDFFKPMSKRNWGLWGQVKAQSLKNVDVRSLGRASKSSDGGLNDLAKL